MKKLILIRGLPGSGKSTLAKKLAACLPAIHLEADMFFYDDKGNYNFDGNRLYAAHKWCYNNSKTGLETDNVIVSNTFTTIKELEPYFILGKEFDIEPTVIMCQSSFGSIHNVPNESIQRMKARFEYNIDELFCKYFR